MFQTGAGCDSLRTLHLNVQPQIDTQFTLNICAGENHGGHTASGIYVDTLVSVYGCDSIRTLDLTVNPISETMMERNICPGTGFAFNGDFLTISGTYRDTLTNIFGCDSIVVLHLRVPPADFLGTDTTICMGNKYLLRSPVADTRWFDNTVSQEKEITESGLYWAVFTDTSGCSIRDTVAVQFNIKVQIPNVFSPNDDGFNDLFQPDFSEADFQSCLLQVYDRWGSLLFSTENPAGAWDGTFRGKPCDAGVYVYLLVVETGFCKKTILKGDVSILR
jgi:gliding motility-associated-like protein